MKKKSKYLRNDNSDFKKQNSIASKLIEALCDSDSWGSDSDGCFYHCNCMNGSSPNIYICEAVQQLIKDPLLQCTYFLLNYVIQ